MHSLVFRAVDVEEALAGRAVPAIALAAHRRGHAVLGQPSSHGLVGVLAAAVAVQEELGPGLRRKQAIVSAWVTMSAVMPNARLTGTHKARPKRAVYQRPR